MIIAAVFGVSRLASIGGHMGDGGLAAWTWPEMAVSPSTKKAVSLSSDHLL